MWLYLNTVVSAKLDTTDMQDQDTSLSNVPPAPPANPTRLRHALPEPADPDNASLAWFAQRAYLEYALSVVKGRALPDVTDGQKPVQRRIIYSMLRMGLAFSGANAVNGAKPVKSARVVGDVLGRFHPHGDQAAYDALVRMAQDFSQRYPLIDGQGNFGSRDGDGAAAMRYTEARLAKITTLLTDEIDMGTVAFVPNYDGSTEEPQQLPARLPFNLLNGASGIAVGMATEIPSHNLQEVADACVALVRKPRMSDAELLEMIPGPDFANGGHIISSASDIASAYTTGKGTLKVRARWVVEDLARGQWQLVITELPHGTSVQKVLQEIEDITNPQAKASKGAKAGKGKKSIPQDKLQLKNTLLSLLDAARDESSKDAPVRLVIEPKSRAVSVDELTQTLLATTSLETNYSMNLTAIGIDGRPVQKSLRDLLTEWIQFREATIKRRSEHRLSKVDARIHILEGRKTVFLNIDEVIAIIRESDEPKQALMQRFELSEIQAEDILDIRLRQLARLEGIKIDKELEGLFEEQKGLHEMLDSEKVLRKAMIKEIKEDAKAFGDPRRTLIQEEEKASAEIKVADEPVTVVVSDKGWVRARTGHGHNADSFSFKSGDTLHCAIECRTVDTLIALGSNGRAYSVSVAELPGARGDGQPITTLLDLEAGTSIVRYLAGAAEARYLLACSGGYGFIASLGDMTSRTKNGKSYFKLKDGETLREPAPLQLGETPASHVLCISANKRVLAFPLDEVREMKNGGRGLQLINLEKGDTLVGAAAYMDAVVVHGKGGRGKQYTETLKGATLENAVGSRAKKGKTVGWNFKVTAVEAKKA